MTKEPLSPQQTYNAVRSEINARLPRNKKVRERALQYWEYLYPEKLRANAGSSDTFFRTLAKSAFHGNLPVAAVMRLGLFSANMRRNNEASNGVHPDRSLLHAAFSLENILETIPAAGDLGDLVLTQRHLVGFSNQFPFWHPDIIGDIVGSVAAATPIITSREALTAKIAIEDSMERAWASVHPNVVARRMIRTARHENGGVIASVARGTGRLFGVNRRQSVASSPALKAA